MMTVKSFEQKSVKGAQRGWRIAAALVLAQFLFLLALTQSETLHRAIHSEAGTPDHYCAVTLLQSGQVQPPGCAVGSVPFVAAPVALATVESFLFSAVEVFLPPSCGPPTLLA